MLQLVYLLTLCLCVSFLYKSIVSTCVCGIYLQRRIIKGAQREHKQYEYLWLKKFLWVWQRGCKVQYEWLYIIYTWIHSGRTVIKEQTLLTLRRVSTLQPTCKQKDNIRLCFHLCSTFLFSDRTLLKKIAVGLCEVVFTARTLQCHIMSISILHTCVPHPHPSLSCSPKAGLNTDLRSEAYSQWRTNLSSQNWGDIFLWFNCVFQQSSCIIFFKTYPEDLHLVCYPVNVSPKQVHWIKIVWFTSHAMFLSKLWHTHSNLEHCHLPICML